MKNIYDRREIAKGVFFTPITDKKFKLSRICLLFITKLSENAAVNAVIPRMLTKCSDKYKTMAELNRKLSELYSAALDFNVSGEGDLQYCQVAISILSEKYALYGEKLIDEAAEILRGCVFEPLLENGVFPAESLETEKQNQIDDNDAEINDKTTYSYLRGYEKAFAGEPAEIRYAGTNDEVRAITPVSAKEAYDRLLRSCRVEMICTGESDFDGVERIFTEAFARIGREPEPFEKIRRSEPKPSPARFTEKLDIEQSKLVMFFKTDCENKQALRVLQTLYGASETSKLFRVVREKLSLCYYCFARMGYLKGFVTTECGVDAQNLEKTEAECLAQLKEVADGSFTDEELRLSKLSIINNIRISEDTIGGLMSRCLSNIMDEKNAMRTDELTEKINAVTREEVICAARSLKLDTVFVLTAGEEEKTAEVNANNVG